MAGIVVAGYSDRALYDQLGILVRKTEDLASAPDVLFDVTGMVFINRLVGVVRTVVATTTTLKLQRVTGTVDMCSATTITTDAVGTMYYWSGDTGTVLNGADAPVVGFASLANAPLLPIPFGIPATSGGSLNTENIQAVLDGAGTGAIEWFLWYTPGEIGAKVTAAA